ncbi:MAG: VWA domain-containing protein [Parachlamydiaceae bacterium]
MNPTQTGNNHPFITLSVNPHPCAQRDYVLIIDKSGSMAHPDMPNGQTRWKAAEETVYALAAKVFEFDPDGLDVWLFSNNNRCYRNVRPERVQQVFQENEPCGGTAMAEVLKNAFDEYFTKRDAGKAKPNGEAIFVITDGEPDNKEAVISTIVGASLRLRATDNLAVHFVQVGNDPVSTQFLKTLDEDLVSKHKITYDFIKTIKIGDLENQGITQTILNLISETARSKMAPAAQPQFINFI